MTKKIVDRLLFDFLETAYLFEKTEEKLFSVSWQEVYALQILIKEGPVPLMQLGRIMMLEKYQATRLISKLDNKGFLKKKKTDRDKRRTLVSITDKGRSIVLNIEDFHYKLFCEGSITLSDQKALTVQSIIAEFSSCMKSLNIHK